MLSLERQEQKYGNVAFFKVFFVRRFFRIYPLSVFVVVVIFLFAIPATHLAPGILEAQKTDNLQLFANLLLFQNFLKDANILGPLWSLPYEIQMYLTFPFWF
jgi:peptidoglycan/LPS O-acetylase OafA/YrhL